MMRKGIAINRAWERWPDVDLEVVAELVAWGWDAAQDESAVPTNVEYPSRVGNDS